jgi:hypothetical protein
MTQHVRTEQQLLAGLDDDEHARLCTLLATLLNTADPS